jgi:hypothetical protein
MELKGLQDEKLLTSLIIVFSLGLMITKYYTTQEVGMTFTFFAVLYLISIVTNMPRIQVLRILNLPESLLTSAAFYAGFITVVFFLTSIMMPSSIFSVAFLKENVFSASNFEALSASSLTAWNKLKIGLVVPIVESMFFLSFILTLYAKIFKVNIMAVPATIKGLLQVNVLWACGLTGMTASLFHLYVRSIAISSPLLFNYQMIVDAAFFAMSALLAVYRKQLLEPIGIHMFHNLVIMS